MDAINRMLRRLRPQSYEEFCAAVYLTYCEKLRKKVSIVGDKNNYYIRRVDRLEAAFPNSQQIIIVRDGRDVACSYLALAERSSESSYYPKLPQSISGIAEEWRSAAIVANRLLKKGAPLIRYEDLLEHPRQEPEKVCEYLSVPFHQAMLEFQKSFDEPEEFLSWKSNLKQPLLPNNKKTYLTHLTRDQVEEYEAIAGDMLSVFGYQ